MKITELAYNENTAVNNFFFFFLGWDEEQPCGSSNDLDWGREDPTLPRVARWELMVQHRFVAHFSFVRADMTAPYYHIRGQVSTARVGICGL